MQDYLRIYRLCCPIDPLRSCDVPHSTSSAAFPNMTFAMQSRETIIEAGKTVESDALDVLTSASDGFAYMVQLVGFRAWAAASQSRTISSERARVGAEQARKDFIFGVVKRTCQELSDGDLAFLEAMLPDHGAPSKVSDVASRMGKTPNYARVYRQRLLDAGVISVPRRGSVSFELPLLREYLENETM